MRLLFLAKYRESGLLLLRLSTGLLFIILVAPTLIGGPGRWSRFGTGARVLGFHGHFAVWGFVGALAACFGAVLMVFGLFFRAGVLLCLCVAAVYTAVVARASGLHVALLPIELCAVLVSLLFIGPGKYSVDKT